jgi:carbonic anhydrase
VTADAFADVLEANAAYAVGFADGSLSGRAARGLAVLTCMDSRLDPLAALGLAPGDAKMLRNAGARVTDEVLATLVLATNLLGVERFMVVAHTDCRMAGREEELHEAIRAAGGPDTHGLHFRTAPDQEQALREDVERVRSWPHLSGLEVGGFVYDVRSGRLARVV